MAEEEAPEKDYRRFIKPRKASGAYQNISKSDIDNLAVLTDSYLFRHQAEEMEAVRNRLDEMKSEYPLDLASLLERKGSTHMQYVRPATNLGTRVEVGAHCKLPRAQPVRGSSRGGEDDKGVVLRERNKEPA